KGIADKGRWMGVDMWKSLAVASRPCTYRLVVALPQLSGTLRPQAIRSVSGRLSPFASVLRCRRACRGGRARWRAGSEFSAPLMSPRFTETTMPSFLPDHGEARIGENPFGRGASREDQRVALVARA